VPAIVQLPHLKSPILRTVKANLSIIDLMRAASNTPVQCCLHVEPLGFLVFYWVSKAVLGGTSLEAYSLIKSFLTPDFNDLMLEAPRRRMWKSVCTILHSFQCPAPLLGSILTWKFLTSLQHRNHTLFFKPGIYHTSNLGSQ
jgi:hypothetical protein